MQNRFNILLQERCFENSSLPFKIVDVLVFSVVTLFAILARISLFPYVSSDFTNYTEVWYNTIKDNGGLFGIGSIVGNTSPIYTYILALLTCLPVSPLFGIKIISCIFDIIIAFTILRIIMGITKSIRISLCGYTAILLSPTIMLNSSAWGAYDSIYTCFILFCLFSFMKNRPFKGLLFFSIALAIKLQAIYFAPVLLVMWLKNRTRVKYFIAIPIVYIISIIPAFLGGRSLFDLIILYIKTATSPVNPSNNPPNLFSLMSGVPYEYITVMGVFICGAIVMIELYLLYTKIFRFTPTSVITIALLFTATIPYFLPNMNERHFYMAEILSILLAFCRPSTWYIAILINLASFISYLPNLFGTTEVNLMYAFLLMSAGIISVVADLSQQIKTNGAKAVKAEAKQQYRQAQQAQQAQQTYTAPAPMPMPMPTPAPAPAIPHPSTRVKRQSIQDDILEYDYDDEEEDYSRSRRPLPSSAYTLSHEALAKKIPSIADIIEVTPDAIQKLQMEEMQIPTQEQPTQPTKPPQPPQPPQQMQPPPAVPASLYEEAAKHNPYMQQIAQNPYANDLARSIFGGTGIPGIPETPEPPQEQTHTPQYPLTTSQRLASDKSPPFSLSQKIPRNEGPPPPPPPPIDAPVVPKMTKSEMISKEMDEPRKKRQIPKEYLQQMAMDGEDFIEEHYDEL